MPERTAIVGSAVGLRARPAAVFVQAATVLPDRLAALLAADLDAE
jgi:phosphotransferase system HPr-like phosphotransfer protein